jgi:signal transduction histidine kinase
VSDDVSVARPARVVVQGTAERPGLAPVPHSLQSDDTWTVSALPLWEIYFAVAFGGVVVHSLVANGRGSVAEQVVVGSLLLAMFVWYVGVGRRIVKAPNADWRGYLFTMVLLVLFVSATALQGSISFLLFALNPLAYMVLPLRAAHVAVVVFSLTPSAVFLASTGDLGATVTILLPISLVAITVSVIMAITTSRTERLSSERAALIDELASSRAEVTRLSREAGIAEERQRLAGEIHDTVAQGLSSVVMLIEAALAAEPEAARRHLHLAARTARDNLDEARAIVGALTPALDGTSLEDALRRVVDRFTVETGVPARFTVVGSTRALPTAVEVVALRGAQEALTNIRKHSGANSARVSLTLEPSNVAVEVTDDGCGFDPEALHGGYGQDAMRHRVEQVGGRLSVHSVLGKGTTVRTEVDA